VITERCQLPTYLQSGDTLGSKASTNPVVKKLDRLYIVVLLLGSPVLPSQKPARGVFLSYNALILHVGQCRLDLIKLVIQFSEVDHSSVDHQSQLCFTISLYRPKPHAKGNRVYSLPHTRKDTQANVMRLSESKTQNGSWVGQTGTAPPRAPLFSI
jgi:hypothetical protein